MDVITGLSNQVICLGQPAATFKVEATGDSLTYKWFKNTDGGSETQLEDGGRISGATTDTLTISNPEISDSSWYNVEVHGLYDSAIFAHGNLIVGLSSITGPSDESVCSGSSVYFWVDLSDSWMYKLQWQSKSSAVGATWGDTSGATGSSIASLPIYQTTAICIDSRLAAPLRMHRIFEGGNSDGDLATGLKDNPRRQS